MRYRVVFILLLAFAVSGCGSLPHSIGPKNVRMDKDPAGSPLERNKKIYVTMIGGVPKDMHGSPEALILQFSKFLAPVASGVSPAERLETRAEALRNAAAQSCDYVFLLTVEQWEKPMFLPSTQVAVNIEALEAGSGRFLSDSRLEATCHAMLYGLENSPRECVRPQVDIWLNTLFAPGPPHGHGSLSRRHTAAAKHAVTLPAPTIWRIPCCFFPASHASPSVLLCRPFASPAAPSRGEATAAG